MAAVMITEKSAPPRRHGVEAVTTRPHLRLVAVEPTPRVRPAPRTSAATFRRRRLVALLGVVVAVFMVGRAGAALGGASLATPGRGPSVTRYVVHSGDTLWSVAHHLAPDSDPREVIDTLTKVRGSGPLMPGEVLRWQR
jgi:nucleoid-associated protein YgaU